MEQLWRRLLHGAGMKCGIYTRKLIPRRRVLLEKQIVLQLVKNLSLPRLRSPQVHYRVRRSPPLAPNLSQIRDIHESKVCVPIIEKVWNSRSTANILFGYWVKLLRYASYYSPKSSADIKNQCSYTPTPPYAFMTGT